jgi:two-component system, NtrC family, sensor histidine kinase HydH
LALKYHIEFKPEGKPFRLVKYFAVASFLVLIVISIPFALFISRSAKGILLKNFEDYTHAVGENLNNNYFNNFAMPVMSNYGQIDLTNEEQLKLLDKIVRFSIRGLNVEVVMLYPFEEGIVVYSTDPSLIHKKVVETSEYERAVKGEQTSALISENEGGWGLGIEKIGGEKKLRTYIPIKLYLTSGEEYVHGVFEVILNMTPQYNSIVKFQYFIFSLSILIMALIFFALLFIVHNAETIIQFRAAEQKKREEQLHLAERLAALGEMVAGVSHEIKNPLGIIQSTAELLSDMNQADEKQRRLSLVIKEESIRLNGIVTEFLDFAHPHELNIQVCRLEEIVRKNISFLSQELEKKGITVKDNFGNRSFKLNGDPERLYRAFMNLLINSIQAIPESGTIDIRIEESRIGYRITIEDTGTGIKEENMKKIFNPFFTTKQKGSGLGLPIVRNIIEGHEGSITLENIDGSGTMVVITLPKTSTTLPIFNRQAGLS